MEHVWTSLNMFLWCGASVAALAPITMLDACAVTASLTWFSATPRCSLSLIIFFLGSVSTSPIYVKNIAFTQNIEPTAWVKFNCHWTGMNLVSYIDFGEAQKWYCVLSLWSFAIFIGGKSLGLCSRNAKIELSHKMSFYYPNKDILYILYDILWHTTFLCALSIFVHTTSWSNRIQQCSVSTTFNVLPS